jgi:hypothetical protein
MLTEQQAVFCLSIPTAKQKYQHCFSGSLNSLFCQYFSTTAAKPVRMLAAANVRGRALARQAMR